MAPIKATNGTNAAATLLAIARKGISTRSKAQKTVDCPESSGSSDDGKRSKRKADNSPHTRNKKRSALGNLTNAVSLGAGRPNQDTSEKKAKKPQLLRPTESTETFQKPTGPTVRPAVHTKVMTRAATRRSLRDVVEAVPASNGAKATVPAASIDCPKPTTRRISNEFEKTEESLYVSALEDVTSNDLTRLSSGSTEPICVVNGKKTETEKTDSLVKRALPDGVIDFDKENWDDIFQASNYAMDIFEYMKQREVDFKIEPYLERQPGLSRWMRSLLVDWMVEVQESFELNHETLYLGVKIVDIYLSKVPMEKDNLQLLGAASLFISCKFDERTPPLVDDFLYICDGAYKQNQLLKMERNVFRTIGYDLGIPLSYRFLRRYARCAKVSMSVLTLARFILEYSLMDYSFITLSDSKMASAALFIALRMNKTPGWNKTLEYYSGYKLEDFAAIVVMLNNGLHKKPRENLNTVRNKYSHKIFHEVAKIPLIDNSKLFEE